MKSRCRHELIAAALAAVLVGCATPAERMAEKGIPPMTAEQVKATVVGNTLYIKGRNWEWAGFYEADGTMRGRTWWNGGEKLGAGIWEVKQDGQVCRDWDNDWGGGGYGCAQWYKDGGTIVWQHISGSKGDGGAREALVKQGNPYGL